MAFDAHKNLAISSVALAPAPPGTGLALNVAAGEGTRFPAPPFNATVWPASATPTPANAEILRVTAITGDNLTIVRAQEATAARAIVVGDLIAATITAKTLQDVETPLANLDGAWTPTVVGSGGGTAAGYLIQQGRYQRVDRWITASFYLQLNGGGTIAGDVQIAGLPFSSAFLSVSTCAILWHAAAVAYVNVMGELDAPATTIRLLGIPSANVTIATAPVPAAALTPNFTVAGTIRYPTA